MRAFIVSFASAALAGALFAACIGPAPADAPIPVGLGDAVDSARATLHANEDGPIRSTFTFRAARCRADGGLLLLFDQHGLRGQAQAYAFRGPGAESWSGGFGIIDLAGDSEIAHFLSQSPEAPCRGG